MNVGTLKENWNENRTAIESITGRIVTYSLNLPFRLEHVLNRRADESPTHNIVAKGTHGQAFAAGVAWQGKTREGARMFSLHVEVPELFDGTMKYVAFDAKDGTFDIRVSKDKPGEVEQDNTAKAA